MTLDELASYCQVTRATVYRWRTDRRGPESIRVGRHVRYRRDAVERWLQAHTQPDGVGTRTARQG